MGFWTKCFVVAVSAWITICLLSKEDLEIYPDLLQNKNVIITGASSGLGEQAAYYCARSGANVVIAARREELLKQVVSKCQELSPNAAAKFKYVVADFSKSEEGKKVISEAAAFLDGIDYLILNHAFLLTSDKEMTDWTGSVEQHQLLKYSMDVNFYSYIDLTDEALPHLKRSNGSLAVVSSMIVEHPAFSLPYAASKNALNSFFTGLRQELLTKKENVSVTLMHLGFIETEASAKSLLRMEACTGKEYEKLLSIFPPTSPSDGGQEIIRATVRRDAYFYFPREQKLWLHRIARVLLKDPDSAELILENWIISFVNFKRSIGL